MQKIEKNMHKKKNMHKRSNRFKVSFKILNSEIDENSNITEVKQIFMEHGTTIYYWYIWYNRYSNYNVFDVIFAKSFVNNIFLAKKLIKTK